MNYLFVLGRNPKLSIAEVLSCFKQKINYSLISDNLLLIKNLPSQPNIEKFGGILAIGKTLFSCDKNEIPEKIKNIYFEEKTKFSYSVINLTDFNIEGLLKEKFKEEKLKSVYKPLRGRIKGQDNKIYIGTPTYFKKRDITYFLVKKEKYYFGCLNQIYNSEEAERRDIEKPFRREELAISPRLAKILINLSGVNENEILLDPFCGVGIILQEALLQDINIIGIDKNKDALEKARKNIEWLKKNYQFKAEYKLISGDSRKIKIEKVDAIVTEPFLGKLLKKIPREDEAERIINDFENLIIQVLTNLNNFLEKKGKIVFTSPFIKTRNGRKGCKIKKILELTGLKIKEIDNITFPIQEFRTKQIVGREIFVLEKP